MVREPSVQLLRHAGIERAQPCLDVRDRKMLLRRDEPAREGGVHVADDDHDRGPHPQELGFEAEHDPCGLLCVASRPTPR